MSDPAGSDRIQEGVPTGSGSGDNSDLASGMDDVPLTREEAAERDAEREDEQPANPRSDLGATRRAGSDDDAAG